MYFRSLCCSSVKVFSALWSPKTQIGKKRNKGKNDSQIAFSLISGIPILILNTYFHFIFYLNRELNTICNFLIAFDAFLYVLNLGANNFILLPLIEAYWLTQPLLTCFLLESIFIFARDVSAAMPFAIGVERLVNVLFPLW